MRWATVALLLVLAGCTEAADPAPPPTTTGPPTTPGPDGDVPFVAHRAMLLAFDYSGCDGQITQVEVDPATAHAALPEGYAAWTQAGPLPDGDPRPTAWVEYLWVRCDTFTAPQVTLNDTVYGHVAVRVAAPGNATEADEHWYRLRMLTAPGVLEAVWEAVGYDVMAAEFSTSTGLMRKVELGAYSLEAVASPTGPAVERAVAYYTDVPAGRLEWTGSITGESIDAVGTLAVPADDPFAGQADPAVRAGFVAADFAGNDLWLRRDTPA